MYLFKLKKKQMKDVSKKMFISKEITSKAQEEIDRLKNPKNSSNSSKLTSTDITKEFTQLFLKKS